VFRTFIFGAMILVFVALNLFRCVESQLAHTSSCAGVSLTDKEEAALKQPWSFFRGRKAPEDRAAERIETSCSSSRGQDRRVQAAEMLNDVQSKLDEGNLDLEAQRRSRGDRKDLQSSHLPSPQPMR